MSYYDGNYEDNFYHEPSEFEQQVDELKESLMKSVKKDVLDEMERLKKENAELQEVKNNMAIIRSQHNDEMRKLHQERQDLKYKVRQERLTELMGAVEYFTVASRGKSKPKCEKCDENRRLYYKKPSGKEAYESCDCNEQIAIYEPIPTTMIEFAIRHGEGRVWYQVKDHGRDEYLRYYDDSISGSELITDETQFEGIGYAYRTLFQTKELAQKFCDLKNKEAEKTIISKPVSPKSK